MLFLDDEQAGFRKGRSTADATQKMLRIEEDTVDLRKRMIKAGVNIIEEEMPAARLLDLRKAYPRVNRPALWKILRKYGMGDRCLRVLQDLHETTNYSIKTKEGVSNPWVPLRGLREGCASSPPLFNIYHQVPMRTAKKKRLRVSPELCLIFRWVPGNNFPSSNLWEKYNSESKEVRVGESLFADDTTGAGKKAELENGIDIIKQRWQSLRREIMMIKKRN